MLAEALKYLEALMTRASATQLIRVPGRHTEAWMRTGSEVTLLQLDDPLRSHEISSFSDILDAATKFKAGECTPSIYFNETQVVVYVGEDDMREKLTCSLKYTQRFVTLINMNGAGASGSPSDIIKLVRFQLNGIGFDELAASLRKVDFTRKSTGASDVAHGRESYGRSVEAEVQGTSNIPEVVDVDVPVYENDGLRGLRAKVRCGIFIDANQGVVTLRPLADEIRNGQMNVLADVRQMIENACPGIPCYEGTPRLIESVTG